MKKLDMGVIVTTLIIVTISTSLAFFAARIVGEPKNFNLTAKDLSITFNDTSSITDSLITPGWSATKTFTITNNSENTYKYNISIKDLVNTFTSTGALQYKITSTNNGYNMTDYKDIPKSSTATDTVLAYSASIDIGVTQNYTVSFRYISDDADTSTDMGKTLSGSLYITEGTVDAKLLSDVILDSVVTSGEGVYNENGYRYEGSNPNNYIYMTNSSTSEKELWRIIGLFSDGTSGEDVIRVRKYYALDNYPQEAYDSNNTNYWPASTLYTSLKETYSTANYKNTVEFKAYLGGGSTTTTYTASDLYDMERMLNDKGTAGKTAQTSYSNKTTENISVGLMYPSDYGYGVLSSNCARTIYLFDYMNNSECYNNNWLFQNDKTVQWLISPHSLYYYSAYIVAKDGWVNPNYSDGVGNAASYSPVMALSNSVKVTGSGTQSDPYVIN